MRIMQAEDLLAIARQFQQAGNLNRAEATYRQVVQIDDRHPEGWSRLGSLCVQLGKVDEAIDHLGRALQLQPAEA